MKKKGFAALLARARIGKPPGREDTFDTLERPAGDRRRKTGRTEQFNVRVRKEFKERIEDLALREDRTLGSLFEAMLAAYEASGGGMVEGAVPASEARARRTRELRVWASDEVFDMVGHMAGERKLSISGLIEDVLAREVKRLDPDGSRFGMKVKM